MSNTFQIEEEIDKLLDKYTEELKIRIKKAILRSEKIVLKQYITSQRETIRTSSKIQEKPKEKSKESKESKKSNLKISSRSPRISPKNSQKISIKMPKKYVRREQEYDDYTSESD
jgi:hypothetical protein